MKEEIFRLFSDIEVKEMSPSFFSKLIHTDANTFNLIDIKVGSDLPIQSHPHHQYALVLKGQSEMTICEETQILDTGKFVVIPSNVPHGGKAITDCILLDIFSTGREDFK